MRITYKNYIIEQQDTHFNLIVTSVVTSATKAKKENIGKSKESTVAFGMTLRRTIQYITMLELGKSNETIELDEYLGRYEKAHKEAQEFLEKNVPV